MSEAHALGETFRAEFLRRSTVDILDHIILCGGKVSGAVYNRQPIQENQKYF